MPATIPHLIPVVDPLSMSPVTVTDQSLFSTYDIAVGGLGFRLASDAEKPMIWETAPYVREQIDQASESGEQTLTNWWVKSQSSFHGGAGNLNLERVDLPAEYTHIRFDQSKNVDVWTPGKVRRLPDTTVVSPDTTSSLVGVSVAGADMAVFADQATADLVRLDPAGGGTTAAFTAVIDDIVSVCTDGRYAFAASLSAVWQVDPANLGAATKIATYSAVTSVAVGWVKGRLMLGAGNTVYELDSTVGAPVAVAPGSPEARYTHPQPGWLWRCFAESPSAILGAGDAGGHSEVVSFTLQGDGGTPVLAVSDTALSLPPGERVLAMANTMGSFLALGTSAGLRIAEFGNGYSSPLVSFGPLTLPASETQFAVSSLACRDRFVYASGLAVDEPGLIRLDLSTKTDQAGRYAYATDLIAPVKTGTGTATAVCALPSGKLLFSVPSVGLCREGTGPGTVREAWLQASRIRYGTTESKLFKLGRVRGDFASSSIRVEALTRADSEVSATVGGTLDEPDEFGLPAGRQEWLALKFTLIGAGVVLASYGVKALPGTKRQKRMKVVLACADRETDRRGHRSIDIGGARRRANALFDLDAAGDEVLFEEFGIYGNTRTLVVIEQVSFSETARPTNTSDFGGQITLTVRTVT